MKNISTESLILVPCLLVGWAIVAIARDVVAPVAALLLTALGWRPAPSVQIISVPTLKPEPMLSRSILEPITLQNLRRMAKLREIDHSGLNKASLIEALLDYQVDRANDYSAEVPTAAERSPSLRRARQ